MIKKLLSAALALCIPLLLCTGCWDQNMINHVNVIAGLGVDWDAEDNCYLATVEVIKLSAGGKSEDMESLILDGKSGTILDAMNKAMGKSSGWLYTNHCKMLLVGEELAKNGIRPIVDTLTRTTDFQPSMGLVVAKGTTAAEILHQKSRNNPLISLEIGDILDVEQKRNSQSVSATGIELKNVLSEKTGSVMAPALELEERGDEKSIEASGIAMFRGDKIAGYLGKDDTKFLLLAKGLARDCRLQSHPEPAAQSCVSSLITDSKASMEPYIDGDRLSVVIKLELTGDLKEIEGEGYSLMDKNGIREIEREYEQMLEQNIGRVARMLQSGCGCDVFGFNQKFASKYNREWRESLGANWDELFRSIGVTVEAKFTVHGSGIISDQLQQYGRF